jgi:alpha-L-fucosidase
MTFGMFICWSFSSFSGYEWTPGVEDINFFNPTGFDPDQWCSVAKDAGMKYILFLTKHHDGFCLWDTQTTDRKVTSTKALKGVDVLAEVRKACERHGLRLALYFSEGDWSWTPENKGIHQSAAKPEIKKAQLKELLTNYGPIEFFWMDHAVGTGGLSHEDTVAFIKSFQPDCFVGFNSGAPAGDLMLRERGTAGPIMDMTTLPAGRAHWKDYEGFRAAEFTYPILEGQSQMKLRGAQWFYSLPENDRQCATAEKIYSDYLGAKKHRNIFSLDVGPDRSGRLRKIDIETLRKVGRYVRGEIEPPPPAPVPVKVVRATASDTWTTSPGYTADRAVDGNWGTRWGASEDSRSGWLELDLGQERLISGAIIDEAGFARIQRFELQVKKGEGWLTFFTGATCGNQKKIAFEKPVRGTMFRLNILEADEVPTVSEFQLFEENAEAEL